MNAARSHETVIHESEHANEWGLVDMTRRLRARNFLRVCIAPLFDRLEALFSISRMRERGISRVMYYMDFELDDFPLALDHPLIVRHELSMHRAVAGIGRRPPPADSAHLFWRSVNRVLGTPAGQGGSAAGGNVQVAVGRAMHVLTRPTAPRGERTVAQVPGELSSLALTDWPEPLPDVGTIADSPGGNDVAERAERFDFEDVWGLPNTDIKQHVNLFEYLVGAENQVTRHLAHAGADVSRYRLRRLQLLFRRPCFAAQRYRLTTRLRRVDDGYHVAGGYYLLDDNAVASNLPAVALAAETALCGAVGASPLS